MWQENKIVEQKTVEKWVRERNQRIHGAGIQGHVAGGKMPNSTGMIFLFQAIYVAWAAHET